MNEKNRNSGRDFLKSRWPELKQIETEKAKGVDAPPLQDPIPSDGAVISLPSAAEPYRGRIDLVAAMESRSSHRSFSEASLSIEELSFLLWATAGVRKVGKVHTLRRVPSGGARHPIDTYLFLNRVDGIDPGVYRYLPLDHALAEVWRSKDPAGDEKLLDDVLMAHNFGGAVSFLWVAAPERGEWSYDFEAHRLLLLDAGHICQNLYLACEAVGCGTCAVGAYDQEKCDQFLGLDGVNRFLVYAAPVGKR